MALFPRLHGTCMGPKQEAEFGVGFQNLFIKYSSCSRVSPVSGDCNYSVNIKQSINC